jgi:hypothetical protein
MIINGMTLPCATLRGENARNSLRTGNFGWLRHRIGAVQQQPQAALTRGSTPSSETERSVSSRHALRPKSRFFAPVPTWGRHSLGRSQPL